MRRRSDLLRFEIGGSRVLRSSDDDEVTLVAAGITLHEALAAADELAEEGVAARVIDLYSIKPIDEQTLLEAAEATGTIVTVCPVRSGQMWLSRGGDEPNVDEVDLARLAEGLA
jgi:transketolase C-terminal domain/subunit